MSHSFSSPIAISFVRCMPFDIAIIFAKTQIQNLKVEDVLSDQEIQRSLRDSVTISFVRCLLSPSWRSFPRLLLSPFVAFRLFVDVSSHQWTLRLGPRPRSSTMCPSSLQMNSLCNLHSCALLGKINILLHSLRY